MAQYTGMPETVSGSFFKPGRQLPRGVYPEFYSNLGEGQRQSQNAAPSGPTAEMDGMWNDLNALEGYMSEEQQQKLMYLRFMAQEYATRISPTGYGSFQRIVGYGSG